MCGSSPCSSTRAKLLETQEGLVREKRGFTSREEATITLGKVKTIQTKCFTFTKEKQSGLEVRPLQATLANQKVEYDLIAQKVESAEYRRRVSSTYTTKACTRGMVLHMLGGSGSVHEWCNDT